MPVPGPKTLAVAGVLLSTATGVVTNLVTARWSPTLAAAGVVLVIAATVVAAAAVSQGSQAARQGVQLRARRRGLLDRVRVRHGADPDVQVEASGEDAEVVELNIDVKDAAANVKATGRGKIRDSSITQQP